MTPRVNGSGGGGKHMKASEVLDLVRSEGCVPKHGHAIFHRWRNMLRKARQEPQGLGHAEVLSLYDELRAKKNEQVVNAVRSAGSFPKPGDAIYTRWKNLIYLARKFPDGPGHVEALSLYDELRDNDVMDVVDAVRSAGSLPKPGDAMFVGWIHMLDKARKDREEPEHEELLSLYEELREDIGPLCAELPEEWAAFCKAKQSAIFAWSQTGNEKRSSKFVELRMGGKCATSVGEGSWAAVVGDPHRLDISFGVACHVCRLDSESGKFEVVQRISLKKKNYHMAHPKTKKGEVVHSVGWSVSSRPEKRAGSVTSVVTPLKRRRTCGAADVECSSAEKTQPVIPREVCVGLTGG